MRYQFFSPKSLKAIYIYIYITHCTEFSTFGRAILASWQLNIIRRYMGTSAWNCRFLRKVLQGADVCLNFVDSKTPTLYNESEHPLVYAPLNKKTKAFIRKGT